MSQIKTSSLKGGSTVTNKEAEAVKGGPHHRTRDIRSRVQTTASTSNNITLRRG